ALRAAVSDANASDLNTRWLGDTAKPTHPVELAMRSDRGCDVTSAAETRPGTITDKSAAAAKIEHECMSKLPVFAGVDQPREFQTTVPGEEGIDLDQRPEGASKEWTRRRSTPAGSGEPRDKTVLRLDRRAGAPGIVGRGCPQKNSSRGFAPGPRKKERDSRGK